MALERDLLPRHENLPSRRRAGVRRSDFEKAYREGQIELTPEQQAEVDARVEAHRIRVERELRELEARGVFPEHRPKAIR